MSRRDATAALQRFNAGRAALVRSQKVPTVAEVWDAWLRDRQLDGLSNEIYRANWAALGPEFGDVVATDVNKELCKRYAAKRFQAGRKPWTVWTELSRLRACLRWGHDAAKTVPERVYVWVPPKGKPRDVVLSPDEIRSLVAAAKRASLHARVFTFLVVNTTGRHTAILDLTWDRVDFETGLINLDDDLEHDPLSRAWRKGRSEVPMNKFSRTVLLQAKAVAKTNHVVEYRGKRVHSMRESFADIVRDAGLPPAITPHVLRHSVSTILDGRGHDARRRGQLLGHAPGSNVTDQVYTHRDASVLVDVVREIEEIIATESDDGR